jgi:hypothetical protein
MASRLRSKGHSPDDVRAFFAWSDGVLDRAVLRPLSHITLNWELTWNHTTKCYEPEDDSFASLLNKTIDELAETEPPARYHDNEDRLAHYLIETLGWPIRKERGRWIGADYDSILEQGGFEDIDQSELLQAAAGRIHAALDRAQRHFDDMEESHQRMLATVLTVILYHRGNEIGYQLS